MGRWRGRWFWGERVAGAWVLGVGLVAGELQSIKVGLLSKRRNIMGGRSRSFVGSEGLVGVDELWVSEHQLLLLRWKS